MNGFTSADMSTAAANGHRDGYQAGYADAVKAFDAAQPAAAQEAVAWQVGDDFYTSESLAIEGIQQWGPSGSIAIPLYAAPVTAAPAVDVATLRALADRWATDRSYTGSPVDDIRALIEKPTMSTPAAPGINVELLIEIRNRLHAMSCRVGDEWEAEANELQGDVQKIIDASPKGGSVDPVCFISPLDARMLRNREKTLRWTGTYWDKKHDDMVPVYFGAPVAMQATSAEVGS